MKKILICMMVLAMLFSMTAFAATRDEALSAAQAVISAEDPDAQLVESDEDDGYYEFEFTSDTARYDVLVDRDGNVVKVECSVGQSVKAGDVLIVLEAMKMEIEVSAPADGTVKAIAVSAGTAVNTDDLLVTLG